VDVAIRLVKELDLLLKSGGIHLSKYVSNCRSLLSEICESDLSPTIVNLDFDRLPVNETLGVFWNTDSDNFEIKVSLKQKPATRRGILSIASQIFDPFGSVQPHALPVKRLVQQLCEMNLGWDDSIPGDLDSSLPPDVFFQADEYRRFWRAVQLLADLFWRRWTKEYLPLLQRRQKWLQPQRNLKVGDLVLVCDEHAIVEETFPDRDGTVRRVRVRTASTEYLRDVRKLCLLEASD